MNIFGSPLVGVALSAIKSIPRATVRQKPRIASYRRYTGERWWFVHCDGCIAAVGATVESAWNEFVRRNCTTGMLIPAPAHGQGEEIVKKECHGSGSGKIDDPAPFGAVLMKELIEQANRWQLHEIIGLALKRMKELETSLDRELGCRGDECPLCHGTRIYGGRVCNGIPF